MDIVRNLTKRVMTRSIVHSKLSNREISRLPIKQWQAIRPKYWFKTGEYWDPEIRTKLLFEVKKVLDENMVNFWLSNGTALGFLRDNDFIPWDDDIDIDVYSEDLLPVFDALVEAFLNLDYVVRATERGRTSKMSVFKEGHKVSIGGLYLDGDQRVYAVCTIPAQYYETFILYEYKGVKFRIPGPKEKYLSHLYFDWEVPNRNSDGHRFMN